MRKKRGLALKLTLVLCFLRWRRLLHKSPRHSLTSFLSHPRRTNADMDGLTNPYCTCSKREISFLWNSTGTVSIGNYIMKLCNETGLIGRTLRQLLPLAWSIDSSFVWSAREQLPQGYIVFILKYKPSKHLKFIIKYSILLINLDSTFFNSPRSWQD